MSRYEHIREMSKDDLQTILDRSVVALYSDTIGVMKRVRSGEVLERMEYAQVHHPRTIDQLSRNAEQREQRIEYLAQQINSDSSLGVIADGKYYPEEGVVGRPLREICIPIDEAVAKEGRKRDLKYKMKRNCAIALNLPGAIPGALAALASLPFAGSNSGGLGVVMGVGAVTATITTAVAAPYFLGPLGLAYSVASVGSVAALFFGSGEKYDLNLHTKHSALLSARGAEQKVTNGLYDLMRLDVPQGYNQAGGAM